MNKKKIIWLLILVAVAIGVWYAYGEYNRKNKDYKKVRADLVVNANDLIREFETNDSIAGLKYNGKDVEVAGLVKAIEKDEAGFIAIVLGVGDQLSSIRCSLDSTHQEDASQLTTGSSAVLRGACTGYNKDEMGLGSDVILNRCVIIENKK